MSRRDDEGNNWYVLGLVSLFLCMVLFLAMSVASCSTIRVNASQVDGTVSVTSSPNQPVTVSVSTSLKDPISL